MNVNETLHRVISGTWALESEGLLHFRTVKLPTNIFL